MRTFVIGDLHGNHKGFLQCLALSDFDYQEDTLISLGDIVDRGPDSYECVEELLKIKKLIAIKGNHDSLFENWIHKGVHELGFMHGGKETLESYAKHVDDPSYKRKVSTGSNNTITTNLTKFDIPDSHIRFFRNQEYYYIDSNKRCFVHGGFNRHEAIFGQDPDDFMWDRSLVKQARSFKQVTNDITNNKYTGKFNMVDDFSEVFVGHTPTLSYKSSIPLFPANVVMLDTGGGLPKGRITIMDIDSRQYWQSDITSDLYPKFDY